MAELNRYHDVMTVEELMEYLFIGRNSAYRLIRSGKIKALKIGRIYRIPRQEVNNYINTAK